MITFQRSISFAGDTAAIPTVHVAIDLPGLEYRLSGETVTRLYSPPAVGTTFDHPTDQTTYRASLSDERLIGDTPDARALAAQYFANAVQQMDLGALEIPASVTYSARGKLLGTADFPVVLIPLSYAPPTAEPAQPVSSGPHPTVTEPLLVAPEALRALLAKLDDIDGRLVLLTVLLITKLSDGTPTFDSSKGTRSEASWSSMGFPPGQTNC